jgi:hypothetical protein
MIEISIKEYVNGFSVSGYDWKTGDKFLNEIHEEKLDALKAIEVWVKGEIIKELEVRCKNASTM